MATRTLLRAATLLLLGALLVLGGCISAGTVSHMITSPPNGGHPEPYPGRLGKIAREFYTERFKVTVGPPPATLSAAIIAPRDYHFRATDKPGDKPGIRVTRWKVGTAPTGKTDINRMSASKAQRKLEKLRHALSKLPYCTPAGTVIILPGWGTAKELRLGSALDFANHGYRVVLVDLRGQGDSSGKYITYGLVEHEDVTQLITALEARGLVSGKLALFGISEGAVTALDTAAEDPRVDSVIAVEPFTSFKTAIRGVGTDFAPLLSDLISKSKLDEALRLADKRTHLNLADTDPLSRVRRIHVPVLYIAGGADDIAPPAGVKALAQATPHANFVELPRYTHMDSALAVGRVAPIAVKALQGTLGKSPGEKCLDNPGEVPAKDAYEFTVTIHYRLGGKTH